MIRVFKVGDPFPDLLHQGHHLPLRTKVGPNGSSRNADFEQLAPGVWRNDRGDWLHPYYTHGRYELRFLPDGMETVEVPGETENQFRWRIRDAGLASAERSGISIRPVEELMASLGIPEPRLELGGQVSSIHDAVKLPTGSLVYVGDPAYVRRFSVLKVLEHRLERVFGPEDRAPGEPVTIYSVPGELPALPVETEASELELAKIALRAWRLGKAAKRRHGWCATFESTLDALGINDATIAVTGESTRTVGEVVDRGSAALLPEGTILWHQWTNHRARFGVYRRTNAHSRNTSRTVRIFGANDHGENSHPQMTIVWMPGEAVNWTVSGHVLREFPVGTRYRLLHTDPTDVRTLHPDRLPDAYYTYSIMSTTGVVE